MPSGQARRAPIDPGLTAMAALLALLPDAAHLRRLSRQRSRPRQRHPARRHRRRPHPRHMPMHGCWWLPNPGAVRDVRSLTLDRGKLGSAGIVLGLRAVLERSRTVQPRPAECLDVIGQRRDLALSTARPSLPPVCGLARRGKISTWCSAGTMAPVATGPGEPPLQVSSQGCGRARDQAARGWPPHGAKPGR